MPLRKTLSRSPSVTDSRAEDFALMWAGERFTPGFWEHPSNLCPYSGGYLFFFLAPFDARPGPWLYLARVQLMGATATPTRNNHNRRAASAVIEVTI